MDDYKSISTLVEYEIRLFKEDEAEKVDLILFKSLVGCL